jgi:hypothetical protein
MAVTDIQMPVRRTELSVLIRVARQYLSVICAVAKEEPELQSSLLRILSPSKVFEPHVMIPSLLQPFGHGFILFGCVLSPSIWISNFPINFFPSRLFVLMF